MPIGQSYFSLPRPGLYQIHTTVIAIGLYHGLFGAATKFVTCDIMFA